MAAALVSPKGMTRYLKCPKGVLKEIFYHHPLESFPGEIKCSEDDGGL